MAMQFLCDEVQKIAVDSLFTGAPKSSSDPSSSETLIISACRVEKVDNPISARAWQPLDPDGGTFRAAISRVTLAPVAGTFTVTWGGDTTSALAFDITAAALSTALNALASITTAGGVTVSVVSGDFVIRFVTAGTRAEITADATSLAPAGVIAEIGTLLDGTVSIGEVQTLRFIQSPAALADLTTAAPSPAGTATTLAVGGTGVNAKYRVTLFTSELNHAYDGRWSIAIQGQESGLIPWDATGDEALAIIEAMGVIGEGNVTVSRETTGVYLIGFQADKAEINMGAMTVDCSALKVIPFMTGELDLRTPAIQLLFDGQDTTTAQFVIEYTPAGGNRREIFRQTVTLTQSVIAQASLTPSPIVDFYTAVETDAAIAAAIAALPATGTMAVQDAGAVNIVGGSIDAVTITNVPLFNGANIDGASSGLTIIGDNGSGATLALATGAVMSVAAGETVIFNNAVEFSGTNGIAINLGTVSGTLASGAFTAAVVGGNPSASVGLTAVNGVSADYMRKDGAPALSQSIVPTWTGAHTFNAAAAFTAGVNISGSASSINNADIGQTVPGKVGATSFGAKYIQRTSTYTITASDYCIDCTSGTFAVTLPTAVGIAGRNYIIANTGAGTITLTGNGSELIVASNTRSIAAGTVKRVISNGTGWIEV